MEKLTFGQLCSVFRKHNEDNKVSSQFGDPNRLIGVVVFKQSNWEKQYSLESRSYEFSSDNKHFIPGMGGNSIFASALDGSDEYIRLDDYNWEIEYCYIK